jgi:hypothetical protein
MNLITKGSSSWLFAATRIFLGYIFAASSGEYYMAGPKLFVLK